MPADSPAERAVSPVVGVALVAVLAVLLSATVITAVPALPDSPAPTAHLTLSADSTTDRIALTHRRGDPLDVTALTLTVRIDGTELSHQPPIPFFGAEGFQSGPTGPFNTASGPTWRAGETASLRLATTNEPQLESGSTVSVTLATEQSVIYEGSVSAV